MLDQSHRSVCLYIFQPWIPMWGLNRNPSDSFHCLCKCWPGTTGRKDNKTSSVYIRFLDRIKGSLETDQQAKRYHCTDSPKDFYWDMRSRGEELMWRYLGSVCCPVGVSSSGKHNLIINELFLDGIRFTPMFNLLEKRAISWRNDHLGVEWLCLCFCKKDRKSVV